MFVFTEDTMEALRQMIMEKGKGIGNDIVKVDMFLNHRIDTALLFQMGKAWADEFRAASSCLGRKPLGAPQLVETPETPHPREQRAFFSCMPWRAIPGPVSKLKRTLDSLEATQGATRHPHRDSRGERSPWLPLETRPDSPGKPGMQPRDPCLPWRGILGPGHTPR